MDTEDDNSQDRVAALVAAANRIGQQPLEPGNDPDRRRRGLIAGAALVVVLALVIGAFVLFDDDGSSDAVPTTPAERATVDAAPTTFAAEDGTVDDDQDRADTANADGDTTDSADDEAATDGGDGAAVAGEDDGAADTTSDDTRADDPATADAGTGGDPDDGDGGDPDDETAVEDDTGTTDDTGTADDAGAGDGAVDAPDSGTSGATASSGSVAAADDDVEESRAVVRGGQIVLEGAVPSQAAADRIEALAAEVLGPDNVINNYVIDPRASDPNLGNITVEDTINFEPDSATLLPSSEPLLNQGLALLTIRPAVTMTVVGHTDDIGSDFYNDDLSLSRANAVKRWFVQRGVDPDRITTEGRGEREPIADNETREGRRLNRRIQFLLENLLVDA